MYSILFEKKFQRKSKNRLLRRESATRFWVQKLRQNQTGALLNGCTVSGAKFRGELESGKKLDVYATKLTGLGQISARYWTKKCAEFRRIFYFYIACFVRMVGFFRPALFMTLAAFSVALFAKVLARLRNNLSQQFSPICSPRFPQQSSSALTPQIKRTP